ncbi:E-selectin-like isoform X2 [Clavelina lepadiformis]|uniref:E-selectin-like isoform X2 n=1 Tax=Clavelina lepadiformis TaxID=159417 RepID=UPI0040419F90
MVGRNQGDECSIPDSCQNGGTCIKRIDDYTCFCGHGYEGKDCSIRLDCLVPPAPTDGSVSPSSGNRVLLDGTITYSCDPGYFMKNQLYGTLKATCLRSGNWNRPTPVCEESRCIVPQTPAHGTLSRATGEKVPADRSVSFTCDEGYTMIGQPTIYCRSSGTWSNEFPECVERQCTDSGECHFPLVYKGRTYKSCIESKIGLADWCSLTAEYDDEWDRCDKSCPCAFYFDVVPARTIVGSIKFPYVPGDSITYSCQAGYNMMRPATIVCQNTGKWSSNPPSCV